MTDVDTLSVWSDHRLVGSLWRNTVGYIGFRYDSNWIDARGFALSRTLPLSVGSFSPEGAVAHRFFANLLPEGGVRDHIVRDLKIPDTDFELLRAIGGECAGALTILPVGRAPSGERRYRPLVGDELTNLVARRGQIYATYSPDQRPRLSLAGAQDKCPILVQDDAFFLPQGEAPSTHILKFELPDYRHVPAYETFTTLLAGRVELPVIGIELLEIDKKSCALVERYDRKRDDKGEVYRLHQEDFCQALGLGHEKKYQDAGGPSFADCYQLVRDESTDPAIDTQNLLRWQVFNVLAGNSDGHAKNLSFLHIDGGGIRLAPFYDLVCTRAIERIDHRLAFDVGGERDPGRIRTAHWNALAEQCDIGSRFLLNLVEETAVLLQDHLRSTKEAFEDKYGAYPPLQRVERVVTQQCRLAVRTVAP